MNENKPEGGTMTTEKEGNSNEDVMGKQLLWGKRKTMDKARVHRNEDLGYKSIKRGNTDDVSVGGRQQRRGNSSSLVKDGGNTLERKTRD